MPPPGVVVASAYGLLAAAGLAPTGVTFLVEGSGMERALGLVLVGLAVLFIVVAIANYRGRRWAWSVVLSLAVAHALILLAAIAQGRFMLVPGLVAAVVYAWYYGRPHVRAWFHDAEANTT